MGVFNSKQPELPEYPHLNISNFPKSEGETITLKDGRLLGFKEYKFQHITSHPIANDFNKEHVILLIPGLPSSRFFCHPQVLASLPKNPNNFSSHNDDSLSDNNTLNIKLYVLERPGIGLSTFIKRSFLDFSQDISEFCDQKQITNCSLIAYSAGGPYGLAAAYAIGKPSSNSNKPLITKAAIISSIAPYNAPSLTIHMPWKLKFAWWLTKNGVGLLSAIARMESNTAIKDPVKANRIGLSTGPLSDLKCVESVEGVEEMFIESSLEMYSRGQIETECYEYSLWGKDWGFQLNEICGGVKCKIWHGEEDSGTTVSMGKYIAEQIPGCESSFVEEKGHLLYFEIWNDVIEWLVTS
ncbi:58_t:CDS:1 [Funneliformis geosporum]|uniref:10773_t:CDS:1 n=1 Tax=Funneliformis geosporum TaxID=1117311 RepID=A0A9W4WPL3_9GLOM|nr:10773_t:CDS:1 [Funneliformis geosporum]CAI2167957.1 58_t:CDS:1 [Funneliformis geosporum]